MTWIDVVAIAGIASPLVFVPMFLALRWLHERERAPSDFSKSKKPHSS